jgi:phage tail-like protein
MPNRRPSDHLVTSKFKIEIDGVTQGAFAAKDGFESTTEVVHYADDIIERKRPGRTRYSNIILKRGFVNTDELWKLSLPKTPSMDRNSGDSIPN